MNKTDYAIIGYLVYYRRADGEAFAGNYPDAMLEVINKIRRLAKKHHRMCEDYCNGKYARTGEFEYYQDIIQNKIRALCHSLFNVGYQFQNDPRGATVRIFVNGKDMTEILYL